MEERFYFCESCGNLAFMAIASGIIPYCCGDEMKKLEPNTEDASHEKHVPVAEYLTSHTLRVKVGCAPHPMTKGHGIKFVCLQTTREGIIRYLTEDQEPEVCFRYKGKPIAVYAYCNLHGLWKAEVRDYCDEVKD